MAQPDFTMPPMGGVARKPKTNVYTLLLVIALVALLVGCLFLYLEIQRFGGFGTIRGTAPLGRDRAGEHAVRSAAGDHVRRLTLALCHLAPPVPLLHPACTRIPLFDSPNESSLSPRHLRSHASNHCFFSTPPAYPVSFPSAPITRWHGTRIETGFRP